MCTGVILLTAGTSEG